MRRVAAILHGWRLRRARRRAIAFDQAVRARLDARYEDADRLFARFGADAIAFLELKARLMWQARDPRRAAVAEDQARHLATRLAR